MMSGLYLPQAYREAGREMKKLVADARKANRVVEALSQSNEPAVDAEHDQSLTSQLDFPTWLPFAAKTYHISPRIEDYILKPMLMMPSDIPNRNGIGFPISELTRFQPPPVARMAYRAWKGCPVHLEHDNEDCTKAYGVVLDAALTNILGYGNGKHWKVMGLVAVDKNKYPETAQKVLSGELNTGSMGTMADAFTCAVCAREAQEHKFMNCAHITSTKDVNWRLVEHEGRQRLAYLNAHFLSPIEFSLVADPAWAPALSDEFIKW